MDYISQHIQATAAKHAVRARMDRRYAAAEAAAQVDELDAMKFAQLVELAKLLKVPGRGTARAQQLREGIRAVRAERLTARQARGAAAAATRAAAIAAAAELPTITTPAGKIRVGSVIVASSWFGGDGQHTVTEISDDIKNGYAGWQADATTRWGYADQVLRVVTF